MRKHAEILSPRLFLVSLFCVAMAFFWKFWLMSLLAIWIGVYLYTQKADHEKAAHYAYVALFLGAASLVYALV